ncbi:MAG: hypothetical protein FJ265_05255 [Planctomycetes bacterium]|nr:hypothetical protein [Planctomycetota bacterium]
MSPSPARSRLRRELLPQGRCSARLLRVLLFAPVVGMLAVMVGAACYAVAVLGDAAAGLPADGSGAPWWFFGGCFGVSLVAAVAQALRVAGRAAGPEYRLCQALRRIRAGDLAFRVHLRRGDLLADLARECNELIEWLNRHPPPGARTGSDVLHVDADAEVERELRGARS